MFKEIDSKMNLPKNEEEILKFWDENKIFEKTLEANKDKPLYSFFDGPPFASGTPHYGHIVASLMKDVVPRYWTMRGRYVPRKWGWDCHGLPIENIAENVLGITNKKQIEEIGVDKFNQTCRNQVLSYVEEWKKVIRRLGRWADMDNAYKTMDLPYMESVWWVFKQLWDKDLVYESYRSMHICPRCETTLSQSEVAEGYKDIKDLSAIAKFELADEPGTYILAWTTTPWTLIGNVALAINPNTIYCKVNAKNHESETNQNYILAKDRIKDVLKDQEYQIIEEFKGSDLIGKDYKPLFDFKSSTDVENKENGWKVYSAPFVTTEDGTGVVHIAPAFGEDDMNLGKEKKLPFVQHVGMDGIIKTGFGEFSGLSVKPIDDHQKTDVEIIKYLASKSLLFAKEKYEHSYPHCWRCETPLLNYATSSWFVKITEFKDEAIKLAEDINWFPKHIKKGRFGKWLEGARDWSISRQRYWASVIPIWKCECEELKVYGSVADLEKDSGQKVTDLHKDIVDKITVPCSKCGNTMHRIPDVLDTWFDSGSMPYAQKHYPFDNTEEFEAGFPAKFIAEGSDQTRAWFYYLHSISSAIKGSRAYDNVIVNGIVLAGDGKKMSKRLQNYPDPTLMFDKYGADVMRFYLLSSPVMAAENLNFKEDDLAEISRGIFRMLWNSYSFFVLYANIDNFDSKTPISLKPTDEVIDTVNSTSPDANSDKESQNISTNLLDQWIISELNQLILDVNTGMEEYNLQKSTRFFPVFIDNLSNWYIRRSRKRFWKSENDTDKKMAYHTLYEVLVTLSRLMAPFVPFLSEDIYKNLAGKESVHLDDYPKANKELINKKLGIEMAEARAIVVMGLSKRAELNIKARQPLNKLIYTFSKLRPEIEAIIAEEVNVKNIEFKETDEMSVVLDTNISDELKSEGLAREIIRNIQTLRKKINFKVDDRIKVYFQTESPELFKSIQIMTDLIAKEVLASSIISEKNEVEGEEEFKINSQSIWIGIKRI